MLQMITSAGGYVLPFLFVLTIVVFFHELGHFLVGRWCGVRVEAFSMGFGPELFAWVDRRGTRWRLAAIPLGGYVRFHGDANGASAGRVEVPEGESEGTTLNAQPVYKRAMIVAAGPLANFILAIVIFTGSFYIYGRGLLLPRIEQVVAGSAAEHAGIKAGDLVVSINGRPVDSFLDLQRTVSVSSGEALTIVVRRADAQLTFEAVPELKEIKGPFGTSRVGILGVMASSNPADWRVETFSLPQSVAVAAGETWYVVERTGSVIGGLFTGREASDQVAGMIGTAKISGEVAKQGFAALVNLAAILSISIGLINLVPIPLLDGGHLLFYGIEAARGRPISERAQALGFRVGLAIVSLLMIFATYNDILHLARG